MVCFGSPLPLRGLRGTARLVLHRDRRKKGENQTMTDEDYYEDADGIEDEESPCDYGADSPCVEPALRNMGNCFECWLYLEMVEESEKDKK